ncbi:hypothetical protein [Archangium violaceum]|uniref:hypothetical protein n=1 Tax=Archangium violaceum TaxID=83451 RepID=UPI0036DF2E22
MSATHGGKHVSGRFVHCCLGFVCLWTLPALAQNKPVSVVPAVPVTPVAPAPALPPVRYPELVVTELRNEIASHSSRIARLLQERAALNEQFGKIGRDEKTSTQLKEQRARLVRAVEDKNRELNEAVVRQETLLSMAAEHAEALEELGNERKLLRFMVGGGVGLRRLEDVQLGPAGGGASPGAIPVGTEAPRVDVLGAVAFLPVDFNSRDRHQTFSLGVMAGLGGNGFPANVYAGLTLKVWILYLNAGANFRKEDAWRQGPPTQAAFWQGAWTPTVFAGVALDSEALLAIQRVLPPKRAPEGLQVDPR